MQSQIANISQGSPSTPSPATDEKIREAVLKLFAAYPATGSAETAESAVGTYVAMLREYPLASIVESAKAFLSGRAAGYNPAFRPSAAQWSIEARKHRDEARAAAMPPKALPPPEPTVSPEERAAVEAKMRELLSSLGAKEDRKPYRHRLTLEDDLAMSREMPLTVSPRLASLIAEQSAAQTTDRQRRAIIAANQTPEA